MGMKATRRWRGRQRGWRRGSDKDWEENRWLNTVERMISDMQHLRRISTGDGSGTGDWQGTEGNRKWQVKTHRKLNRLESRKPEYKTKPEKYKTTRILTTISTWAVVFLLYLYLYSSILNKMNFKYTTFSYGMSGPLTEMRLMMRMRDEDWFI